MLDLTRFEKVSIASSIVSAIGESALAQHVDLNRLTELCEEPIKKATARQCGVATISVLNKIIDSLSEGMEGGEEMQSTVSKEGKTSVVDQNAERILIKADKIVIEGENK